EPRGLRGAQALHRWTIASSSFRRRLRKEKRSCARPGRSWRRSSRGFSPAPSAPAAPPAKARSTPCSRSAPPATRRRRTSPASPRRARTSPSSSSATARTASGTSWRCAAPCPRASPPRVRYASELVSFIRKTTGDWFRIEVACYPEYHPQTRYAEDEVRNFKRKVDAGADSAITQYFYNADAYFRFVDEAHRAGIAIPIVP